MHILYVNLVAYKYLSIGTVCQRMNTALRQRLSVTGQLAVTFASISYHIYKAVLSLTNETSAFRSFCVEVTGDGRTTPYAMLSLSLSLSDYK